MDLETLLSLCRDFNGLGWAVQDQLDDVLEGEELAAKNPNALRYIEKFLRKAARNDVEGAEELADQIKAHLAAPAK